MIKPAQNKCSYFQEWPTSTFGSMEIPIDIVLDKIWYEGEHFSLEFLRSSDFSVCQKANVRCNNGRGTSHTASRKGISASKSGSTGNLKSKRMLLLYDLDKKHPFSCQIDLLRKFNGLKIKHFENAGK